MLTDIPELIYGNPLLLAGLTVALIVAVHYQRGLSYGETVRLEGIKSLVFGALDAWATKRVRSLATELPDADHVGTWDATPRDIVDRIRPPAVPNLTSTAKYRFRDGVEWCHSQWAIRYRRDGDPWQTHVILFERDDGRTAVHVHVEASVTDPVGHTEGEQLDGDAHGKFAGAFARE